MNSIKFKRKVTTRMKKCTNCGIKTSFYYEVMDENPFKLSKNILKI